MQFAPIPDNERSRLRALAELRILDTEGEERFDAIVRLAAMICGTPISSISLLDAERQWFKASVNLGIPETHRDISFCGHTILQEQPLIVEDAQRDVRFHDNPFVVGAPYVRFYAGHRLFSPDGHAVGTLCVIDSIPRHLSVAQHEALQTLAAQASTLMELRLRVRQLEDEVERRTRAEMAAEIARRMADEARQAAEEANRAKSEFLAKMSHELRTPLNAIIGFSAVLRKNRGGEISETGLSYLQRIWANGEHLLRLIDDILDLAKVEASHDGTRFGAVNLTELVHETVDELQGRLLGDPGAKAVILVAEVPAGVAGIESDRLRLKQILINLVGNALKFTEHGRVVVRVVADSSGVPLQVDVVDSGIGIAADRLEAVFAPFEQADRDTALRFGGTGLGLAISNSLAARLGYRITVESTVGAGSTFSVRLWSGQAMRAA